ncbi:unnamed protein product [Pleuronectes platessa]|uniref:Uncharacterized protein n=1 Tax=Pleuronectes platessa TaxID=8262 RepID=A0A9N7VD59_PLEPL|nr:unnamed protein product [Pleuronectes platessa]
MCSHRPTSDGLCPEPPPSHRAPAAAEDSGASRLAGRTDSLTEVGLKRRTSHGGMCLPGAAVTRRSCDFIFTHRGPNDLAKRHDAEIFNNVFLLPCSPLANGSSGAGGRGQMRPLGEQWSGRVGERSDDYHTRFINLRALWVM